MVSSILLTVIIQISSACKPLLSLLSIDAILLEAILTLDRCLVGPSLSLSSVSALAMLDLIEPVELLLAPSCLLSRVEPGPASELWAGHIATEGREMPSAKVYALEGEPPAHLLVCDAESPELPRSLILGFSVDKP